MTPSSEARAEARAAVCAATAAGDTHHAMRAAQELLRQGGAQDLSFLRREIAKATTWSPPLTPVKVALLSSFSIEFVEPALVAHGFLSGLAVQIHRGGFGQFRQAIVDPDSPLYAFEPEFVILAVEGEDWAPMLYHQALHHPEPSLNACIGQSCGEGRGLAQGPARRSAGTRRIHNFGRPRAPRLGLR